MSVSITTAVSNPTHAEVVSGRLMILEEKRKGTRLFAVGDVAGTFEGKMYVVLTGTVKVTADEDGPGGAVTTTVTKGQPCGDGPAFTEKGSKTRAESAECQTACSLLVLRKAEYHQAILDHLERTFRPTTNFLKKIPVTSAARMTDEECFKLAMAMTRTVFPSGTQLVKQAVSG